MLTNWAGSHTFAGGPVVRPTSVEEVADVVAGARHVRALGSRHSFHDLADSPGTLVALDRLEVPTVVDPEARTVTVGAGVRYGELAADLHAAGWALHTMASLPHIAVAGTIATATHGSGDRTQNLSAAVRGLELVGAGGEVRTLGPAAPALAARSAAFPLDSRRAIKATGAAGRRDAVVAARAREEELFAELLSKMTRSDQWS